MRSFDAFLGLILILIALWSGGYLTHLCADDWRGLPSIFPTLIVLVCGILLFLRGVDPKSFK